MSTEKIGERVFCLLLSGVSTHNNYLIRELGGVMNKKEIEQALRDYHWMINEIQRQRELLQVVGNNVTSKFGIESAQPKAKGSTSDPVVQEVIRRDKASRWVLELEKKVIYIQERIPLITDERE